MIKLTKCEPRTTRDGFAPTNREAPSNKTYERKSMTIEQRRDADIVRQCGETTAIKKQYMDAQEQRTIDAAVGKVRAAIKSLEARIDALEARQAKARQDARLGPLRAYFSRPVKAYELDETASLLRRYPIFGDRP